MAYQDMQNEAASDLNGAAQTEKTGIYLIAAVADVTDQYRALCDGSGGVQRWADEDID